MGKYDKYFIFETPPNPIHPDSFAEPGKGGRLFTINDEMNQAIKDAYYFEVVMMVNKPPSTGKQAKPHNHAFGEYIVFIGTNPEDPYDLGAEVEFWMENEQHFFNKSCIIYVPAKVYHTPIIFHKIDRPFIWITSANTLRYKGLSYSDDPRWADYAEMPEEIVRGLPDWMVMDSQKKKYNL